MKNYIEFIKENIVVDLSGTTTSINPSGITSPVATIVPSGTTTQINQEVVDDLAEFKTVVNNNKKIYNKAAKIEIVEQSQIQNPTM